MVNKGDSHERPASTGNEGLVHPFRQDTVLVSDDVEAVQRAAQREAIRRVLAVPGANNVLISQGMVTQETPWEDWMRAFMNCTEKAAFLQRALSAVHLHERQITLLERGCDDAAAGVLCEYALKRLPFAEVERFFLSRGRCKPVVEAMTNHMVDTLKNVGLSLLLQEYAQREKHGNFPMHAQRAFFVLLARKEEYPVEGLMEQMRYNCTHDMPLPANRLTDIAHNITIGRLRPENGTMIALFKQIAECRDVPTDTVLKIMCLHPVTQRMMLPDWRCADIAPQEPSKA